MDLKRRAYPTALVAELRNEEGAVQQSLEWLVHQDQAVGGQVMVWAAGRPLLSRAPTLVDLVRAQGVVSMTPRTRHQIQWFGGAVLACWPDADHLAGLAEDPRVWALCVLPSSEFDVRAWRHAVGPEVLGDARGDATSLPMRSRGPDLDPVVMAALGELTDLVHQPSGLLGDDRDIAITILQTLQELGHPLLAWEIYTWAMARHWFALPAQRLRELAQDMADGKRLRPRRRGLVLPDGPRRWMEASN